MQKASVGACEACFFLLALLHAPESGHKTRLVQLFLLTVEAHLHK
jgi:hypothetical protein